MLALLASFTTALHAADEAGFKSLFNGKDLTGWEGNPKLWSVQDGCITGKTGAEGDTKIKHNTFLIWKGGEVADFELRLQYKIVGGNSGIQYRSKLLQQGEFGPIVGGYQGDFEAGKTYSGILYEERARGILAKRGEKVVVKPGEGKKPSIEVTGSLGKTEDIQAKIKSEDWNDYVIIAKGNHLQHFINGMQTIDVTDEDSANSAKSGILALQIHQGPPMTVQFKKIRIKNLGGTAKGGVEAVQGNWRPVEITGNGEPAKASDLSDIKLTVTGKAYTVVKGDGGDRDGGTFDVDDNHSPKRMDITTKNGDQVPAIYEITGDTMRVCYGLKGTRPRDFTSTAESGRVLAVYQRK